MDELEGSQIGRGRMRPRKPLSQTIERNLEVNLSSLNLINGMSS